MVEPLPAAESLAAAAPRAQQFHGRRIVAIAAACHALGFGLLGLIDFVNTPLAEEFGVSQAQLGLGLSLTILCPALLGLPIGWLLDRGPLRTLMLCGVAVMLTGFALISRAPSPLALVVGFGVVTAGMSMYGHFPAQVLMVNWFVVHRGKALAIAAMGTSVAAIIVPQVSSRLIASLGWRDALLAIGLGAAAIAAPLFAAFAIKRPEQIGQHPDGLPPLALGTASGSRLVEIPVPALLRDPSFWLIGFGTGLAFCAAIPGFYLIRYMETELGIPAVQAAWVPTTRAVFGLIGKLVAGWAIDRVDKRAVVLTTLALSALGWVAMVNQASLAGLIVAAIPLGLGFGGFLPLAPVLQGACFGRAMIGRVAGMHALLSLPFLILVAPLFGWWQQQSGSFVQPFLGLAAIFTLAMLVLGFVRLPAVEPGR